MPEPFSFTKVYHSHSYPSISPSNPLLSARGKVVVITGAGTGIGAATALAFAAASARRIVLCGRRLQQLQETATRISETYPDAPVDVNVLDVTDDAAVGAVFQQARADVCVNCAGRLGGAGPVSEASPDDFWASFETNVKGAFSVARHFVRNRKRGRAPDGSEPVLISMNSLLSHMPAVAVSTAPASYTASKAAQAKLVEALARENDGRDGNGIVRCYSVQPGVVESEMSTRNLLRAPDPEAKRAELTWDEVDLPAHFCLWLSSPEGRAIPSGRFLWANWDVEELKERSKELYHSDVTLNLTLPGWPYPEAEQVQ